MAKKKAEQEIKEAAQTATQEAPEKAAAGTVKGGALNVRRCPKRTAEIVRVLQDKETVEILETVKEWYRIKDGYIRAEYVEVK